MSSRRLPLTPWPGTTGRIRLPRSRRPSLISSPLAANAATSQQGGQVTVASWEEHLRQHRERQTGSDRQDRDDAAALSDPRPQTDHYLATNIT
jgi:hypothetical protein